MPKELDKNTIDKVSRICRLNLTPDEEERLLIDLKEILSAFSMLDDAETECDPAFHAIDIRNYLREDEPGLRIDPDEVIERMNILQRYIRGPRMQ